MDSNAEYSEISRFVLQLMTKEKDLQSFLDELYARYGMPVIVTDMAYRLIAYGGRRPCADPLWQKLIDSGAAEPETVINEYFGDGFTDRMITSDGPVDATWGVNADYPQCTCTVKTEGSAEGCCSVLYMDRERLDFALELNAAAAAATSVYLSTGRYKSGHDYKPERAAIARFLLENPDTPISLLYGTEFYRTEKLTPGYMAAVISPKEPNPARMQNVLTCIRAKYPQMLYIYKGSDAYLFFWNLRSEKQKEKLLEELRSDAQGKLSLVIGVSGLFGDAQERGLYIEQARLAMECGRKGCGDNDIKTLCYYDCYVDILLRLGYDVISPENLVLPEIKTLQDYDRENNTGFFASLECYLDEYCDISNAAAKLFIHRNSLFYRLSKCEDIMGLSLKDKDVRRKLSLCCSILRLKENEHSKK